MNKAKKKKLNVYSIIGLMLIVSALAFAFYNMWDEVRVKKTIENGITKVKNEQDFSELYKGNNKEEVEIPDYKLNPNMDMPIKVIDGLEYIGVLNIPNFDLELPIIKDWSYEKLKTSPCRFAGSPYKNNFIIIAHNYNSHFGMIKKLEIGDNISFSDMDGNIFNYQVSSKEIIDADDVEGMLEGDWDLTLFTCALNRVTRVTIRCKLLK